MATTQKAIEELVTQVPSADQYGFNLIKEKVDFLTELNPPQLVAEQGPEPEQEWKNTDAPIFDGIQR